MKKSMKTVTAVILSVMMLAVMALSLVGCQQGSVDGGSKAAEETQSVSITDSRGVKIELDKPAEKIVCLLNSALNDLYMLGGADKVIGIDQWTYDNAVTYNVLSKIDDRIAKKEIPAIDSNVEKIISLNPDVVIIWAGNEDQIKALEEHDVKVVGIQVDSFDEVYTKLDMVAAVAGKKDRAAEIKEYTKNSLNGLNEKIATIKDSDKKSGIFVWGPSTLDLAGKTSTGSSLLDLCGLTNCAAKVDEEHFVAKLEDVIKWNPDAIMMWNIADLSEKDYLNSSQWKDVTAIKDQAVYEIPDEMTFYCDLWTVKYAYAAQLMAKNAYPELFKDVDMDSARNDMMMALYGKTAE